MAVEQEISGPPRLAGRTQDDQILIGYKSIVIFG